MSTISYHLSDQIATVTIDREASLNALNRTVLTDLDDVLARIEREEPRCVIVTGAGERAFVAGADIAQMSSMTQPEAAAFSRLGNGVFLRLERLPMPTIAAVNGYALGGGCELAMSCDIRLASSRAVFAQPEVGLGIPAGFGGTQRMARLIGPAAAKELLFSGRQIRANRALVLGLVSQVHEPELLLPAAQELAAEIAGRAPLAVRATKAALSHGLELPMVSAVEVEAELFASCFETTDQRQAMAAFVEKRQPPPFLGV